MTLNETLNFTSKELNVEEREKNNLREKERLKKVNFCLYFTLHTKYTKLRFRNFIKDLSIPPLSLPLPPSPLSPSPYLSLPLLNSPSLSTMNKIE